MMRFAEKIFILDMTDFFDLWSLYNYGGGEG